MAVQDSLADVIDRLVDEGDRVYLGSTNDVERLKRILSEAESLKGGLADEARELMADLRAKAGA